MSFTERVRLPKAVQEPFSAIVRRLILAALLVVFVAVVVRVGGDGYVDVTGDDIGFLDAMYYAGLTGMVGFWLLIGNVPIRFRRGYPSPALTWRSSPSTSQSRNYQVGIRPSSRRTSSRVRCSAASPWSSR